MLFDASAIINMSRNDRSAALLEGNTLDLAFYEVGNAVRREVCVEKALTMEEGTLALDSMINVMTAMGIAERVNHTTVLHAASRESLTFYDASYLCAAEAKGQELVTDDKSLYDAAKKRLKVLKSADVPLTKTELLRRATERKGLSSEELRKTLRGGRAEDRRHEEELERPYLP